MSSLRNAVKRVTHKERSQPQARAHLGLLEKKSDYKLRSKDYHRKQDRLKSMRSKAANRNPDAKRGAMMVVLIQTTIVWYGIAWYNAVLHTMV